MVSNDPSVCNPSKAYLCRLVQKGPSIYAEFNLKERPYIGTTSMDCISAHLAANAARLLPGHVVLDPFCGTGSLLISCAALGAAVVGTDIDSDTLGLSGRASTGSGLSVSWASLSKNSKFRRKGFLDRQQHNKDINSNFEHYGLDHLVWGLAGIDVQLWLTEEAEKAIIGRLGPYWISSEDTDAEGRERSRRALEFDAIVTDPPFGRRERALASTPDMPMGDPDLTTSVLFAVAGTRLKPGGRLVFWRPAGPLETEESMRLQLEALRSRGGDRASSLVFERARPQVLH
eukprot:gene2773-3379_t